MTVKIVAVSLAALAASIAVRAAAPAPGQELRVDITAPVAGTRLQWQSQAPYAVTVSYDGKSTRFGEVPSNAVVLRAAYVANADAPPRGAALPDGIVAISQSNCSGCHDFAASSAGPSFAAISMRYAGKPGAEASLSGHIRSGSHGSWGAGNMPPHPDLSPAEAAAIARWIVTEAGDPSVQFVIGKSGSFRMRAIGKPGPRAGMVLSASYTGPLQPGGNRTPAAGRSTVVIRGSGS